MLMFFTSGTTGYPKIAGHNYKYPLGHYLSRPATGISARRDGLHFTISDTGWGKARLGQALRPVVCARLAIFVYDFDRFHATDSLLDVHPAPPRSPPSARRPLSTACSSRRTCPNTTCPPLNTPPLPARRSTPRCLTSSTQPTGLRLMEGFGQTETTLTIATFRWMKPKPGSMGKPSPLYDIDIVDEDGNACEARRSWARSSCDTHDRARPCGMFMGYYRRSGADQERLARRTVPHRRHGLAAMRTAIFWYVGRTDDVIKSSGYRIGPFEVESVAHGACPAVLEMRRHRRARPGPRPGGQGHHRAGQGLRSPPRRSKRSFRTMSKSTTAPYKYPARRRIRGRAAQDHQRQDPAQSAVKNQPGEEIAPRRVFLRFISG